jgi:hypothetical protein
MLIEVFGAHTNLVGAKWICQNSVDEADFYEAIASFNGVKGLEKIAENAVAYRICPFPLKLPATTDLEPAAV